MIHESAAVVERPQVGYDGDGNAIAIWNAYDASGAVTLWGGRHVPGTGWTNVQSIGPNTGSSPGNIRLAVSANGTAVAVWKQYYISTMDLRAVRYNPVTGWGAYQLLETSDESVDYPSVAIDPAGNALVLWRQSDGTALRLWWNRFVSGSVWSGPQPLTPDGSRSYESSVAMDSFGGAMAIWRHDDDISVPGQYLAASRFLPSGGWGPIQDISVSDAAPTTPLVVCDRLGGAVAAWIQHNGAFNYNVWANRFTPFGGWTGALAIDNLESQPSELALGGDDDGNALVVWRQFGESGSILRSNAYTAATGWTSPVPVGSTAATPREPSVAMSSGGTAMLVWRENTTISSVWVNRWIPGSGWETPMAVETSDVYANPPAVAATAEGAAMVVWVQDGSVAPQYGLLMCRRFD